MSSTVVESPVADTVDQLIAEEEKVFLRRQPRSTELIAEARVHLAGGATSNWQIAEPQAVWMSHGAGSKVYDVDGNEYVDMSLFTQWVPADWNEAPHTEELDAYADRLIDLYDQVAPGFKSSITHRDIVGPYEMEQEYGLLGGNIFHGELSLEQLFHMRRPCHPRPPRRQR